MNILTDRQYKSYDKLSRYSAFPIYYNTHDNKYQTSTVQYLKDTTTYVYHHVTHGDTYDVLALKYYNNPTYYWVICSYNHIQDCFEVPKEGTYIKIPVLSNIQFETY